MSLNLINKGSSWAPFGPQGLLVQGKYTANMTLTNTLGGSQPALQVAQVFYTMPVCDIAPVRVSFSFNQFTGSNLTRVNFCLNGTTFAYRTIIPAGGGASGATLTAIIDALTPTTGTPVEHSFEIKLQSFVTGTSTIECGASYPAWLTVESIR